MVDVPGSTPAPGKRTEETEGSDPDVAWTASFLVYNREALSVQEAGEDIQAG